MISTKLGIHLTRKEYQRNIARPCSRIVKALAMFLRNAMGRIEANILHDLLRVASKNIYSSPSSNLFNNLAGYLQKFKFTNIF